MIQLVILAGGKGTRLADCLRKPDGSMLPKPLVPVEGLALLERQLRFAHAQGIRDVLILVNHLANQVEAFCRAHDDFGMTIRLLDDGTPRGTAGALLAALPQLADRFVVMYGDTLINADLQRFMNFHHASKAQVTLFLHPNDHPHDSDLVEIDDYANVTAFHSYPHPEGQDYRNLVNAALYVIEKSALAPWVNEALPLDCAKDLFPRMVAQGQAFAGYVSPEYIKDIGTPSRLARAEEAIRCGRFAAQSLCTPQRAVFLDRDGVINVECGHMAHPDQFELLPGAADAIRALNHAGWLVVVVTNQPVIARGECDEAGLRAIHNRMETLLGNERAYIDRLYYCPHHPHKGFAGERAEFKGPCDCRKPDIGMLEQARNDMHIDFAQSWMIGDRTADILCAQTAGVRSILVHTGEGGKDLVHAVTPNYEADNLKAAVNLILQTTKG